MIYIRIVNKTLLQFDRGENFEKLRELGDQFGGGESVSDSTTAEEDEMYDHELQLRLMQQESDKNSNVCDTKPEEMDLSEMEVENSTVVALSKLQISGLENEVSPEEMRADDYSSKSPSPEDVDKDSCVNSINSSCDNPCDNSQTSTDLDADLGNETTTNVDCSCDKTNSDIEQVCVDSDTLDTKEIASPSTSSESQETNSDSVAKEPSDIHIPQDNVAVDSDDVVSNLVFDSFQYWRPPIPDIDLSLIDNFNPASNEDSTNKPQEDEKQYYESKDFNLFPRLSMAEGSSSASTLSSNDTAHDILLENLSKLTSGEDQCHYTSTLDLEIHNASISTATEQGETIHNIGSTHVLGEHLGEQVLKVVNGSVLEGLSMNM